MKSRKIFEHLQSEEKFRYYPPEIIAAFRRWAFYRYLKRPKDITLTTQELQIVKDHPELTQYIQNAMQQFINCDNPIKGHLMVSVIWYQEESKGERVAWAPWFLQLSATDLEKRRQKWETMLNDAREGFGLFSQ
jgi:hypothetical protein